MFQLIIVEKKHRTTKAEIATKLNKLYEENLDADGINVYDDFMQLFNMEIVANSTKDELINIAENLEKSNFGPDDIEEYLLHQSNIYYVENKWVLAKKQKPKNNALQKLKRECLS